MPADVQLLVDEARIGCTSGMLLCLDREQRLVYILGEIFGVTDIVGAELLEISRDELPAEAGARPPRPPQLHARPVRPGQSRQSLPVREEDPGVHRRPATSIPQNLLFARAHVTRVREVAAERRSRASTRSTTRTPRSTAIIRSTRPPDFVAALRKLIDRPDFRSTARGK